MVMVRKVIHKNKILYALTLAVIAPLAVIVLASGAHAAETYTCTGAGWTSSSNNCKNSSGTVMTNGGPTVDFNVNVQEVMKVAVTTTNGWNDKTQNSGAINTLLRNKISVAVMSNNAAGFTVSMTAGDGSISLKNEHENSGSVLAALATADGYNNGFAASSFPANYWGYSITDTDAGSSSATYLSVAAHGSTPNTIMTRTTNTGGTSVSTPDIYIGAKANSEIDSGTYSGSVVISVVSGVIDNNTNPVTPSNPATPTETTTNNPSIAYNSGTNYTTRTTTSTSGTGTSTTTTTTTEVSKGDNRTAYSAAQGVTTTAKISEGTPLATGLAVTAAIAAASGLVFFIIAKRKSDDDEEEA